MGLCSSMELCQTHALPDTANMGHVQSDLSRSLRLQHMNLTFTFSLTSAPSRIYLFRDVGPDIIYISK